MHLRIFQVDAFTDHLFGGNPAAVVPLEAWLPDEMLQQIAAENNLAETAFFIKNKEGYHLRWFTPAVEVDLCGHATVATAHVLWQHLGFEGNELSFYSRSGILGVKKDGDWYTLDFPTDHIEQVETPDILEKALDFQPSETWKGREDYLLFVENQAVVERLDPDFRLLAQLKSRGVIVTARGADVDFVSRCFFPAFGIDEDPATGSAHTTLMSFWAKKLGKNDLTARQISRRGGYLKCTLQGDRTAISGQAVTYLEGKLTI
ncbi:MAG: PhzF family phenazine biosynthesis protein [Bacteroidetes bacterium]|nr:PhzF family phenazine biosynthesis protein [Bacteroidota bacterium]